MGEQMFNYHHGYEMIDFSIPKWPFFIQVPV